jgi:thiol-disulfide isomerase/thioredoxin
MRISYGYLAYAFACVGITILIFEASQWYQHSNSKNFDLSRVTAATAIYQDHFSTEKKKLTFVNFWASWCPPCIEETPSMLAFIKKNDQLLQLYSVSQDDNRNDVTSFLKGFPHFNQTNVRLIWDSDHSLAKNFKVTKLPETFLFNQDGHLIRQISGSLNWSDPALQDLIDSAK